MVIPWSYLGHTSQSDQPTLSIPHAADVCQGQSSSMSTPILQEGRYNAYNAFGFQNPLTIFANQKFTKFVNIQNLDNSLEIQYRHGARQLVSQKSLNFEPCSESIYK